MAGLQQFTTAVSRFGINHDGKRGTAPDAVTWDKDGILRTRTPTLRLTVDHASMPGPPSFLDSSWCSLSSLLITQEDVAGWPQSVNILIEFTSFLATLQWPQGGEDLGKFGASYFELLVIVLKKCWAHPLTVKFFSHPPVVAKLDEVVCSFTVWSGLLGISQASPVFYLATLVVTLQGSFTLVGDSVDIACLQTPLIQALLNFFG